jgi:hypothetical protein
MFVRLLTWFENATAPIVGQLPPSALRHLFARL